MIYSKTKIQMKEFFFYLFAHGKSNVLFKLWFTNIKENLGICRNSKRNIIMDF